MKLSLLLFNNFKLFGINCVIKNHSHFHAYELAA